MTMTDEHIQRAVSELRKALGEVEVPAAPRPAHSPRRWTTALAAAVVVVAGLVLFAPPRTVDDTEGAGIVEPPDAAGTAITEPAATTLAPTTVPETTTTSPAPITTLAVSVPPEGPIFGVETGSVILLDDGIDGLIAIDPDARLAARSIVEGQRAGDEPYSMVRVGDSLVVGWSEIFAVDIATREATSLGRSTIFVPAAEPGRVWMVDWPGGAIGSGEPQVWQVTVDGEQVTDRLTLDVSGFPAIGIAGGLALEHDQGIVLWDAATGGTVVLPGDGHGFVFDAAGDELVWCAGLCTELIVTDTGTLESDRFRPPTGFGGFVARIASFRGPDAVSPSGGAIAALVSRPGSTDGDALWILDRTTGVAEVVGDPAAPVDYVTWGLGDQVFATSWSYAESRTVLWRYDAATGDFASVVLPFGGGLAPVVVDDALADAYLGERDDTEPCPRPSVQPSGRSGICTFGF